MRWYRLHGQPPWGLPPRSHVHDQTAPEDEFTPPWGLSSRGDVSAPGAKGPSLRGDKPHGGEPRSPDYLVANIAPGGRAPWWRPKTVAVTPRWEMSSMRNAMWNAVLWSEVKP